MRSLTKVAVIAVVCLIGSSALANEYSIVPPDRDLGDLDHYYNYTWGIDTPWNVLPDADDEYELAVSATLSFSQIRNWRWESNVLYIHLLDDAPLGITRDYDGQRGGDNFEGQGIVLEIYRDIPAWPAQDMSYTFTDEQVAVLNDYAEDGRFALAFDPDCHFWNCGVELAVSTGSQVIPEPATMVLLGAGGLAILHRRRRRK